MVLLVTASVAPELLLRPPPLLLPTRLAELLMMLLRSVNPPWLRMAPPPLPSATPLVIVNPEMVTIPAKFSNTRETALPLTARVAAPGPLMVTLWVTCSSPLVNRMVPETPVASIVSPSLAMLSAWRSEPGPLSFVLVTKMVVAYAGIAVMKSSAVAMTAGLIASVNLFFIFVVGVQSRSPEFGHKRDIYFAFLCAIVARMAGRTTELLPRKVSSPRNSSLQFPYL